MMESQPDTQLPCPEDEVVLEWLSGRLDNAHLDRCEDCRRLIAVYTRSLSDDPRPVGQTGTRTLLAPGTQIDAYRIERLVGYGGMGEVYLAHDLTLDRAVALKLISCNDVDRADILEAQTTARLRHPNIVGIYGAGTWQERLYIAFEYIEGTNLRQRLHAKRPGPSEAHHIAVATADALGAAHAAAIVHLDLKPENIMIGNDGRVLLVDFGLAARLRSTKKQANADTSPSAAGGTPEYMAPERWQGNPGDAHSDMWSFGVVLCELFSGRSPIEATELEGIAELIAGPKPLHIPSSSMPAYVDRIARACLTRSPPDARPSAREVAQMLRDAEPGLRSSRPGQPISSGTNTSLKNPWRFAVALGLTALLTTIGWLYARQSKTFEQPAQEIALEIQTQPIDAELLLNGEPVHNKSLRVDESSTPVVVTARARGHISKSVSIVPDESKTIQLSLDRATR